MSKFKLETIKSQEDLDQAITKAIQDSVADLESGLKTKNTELLDELKELKRQYEPFKGLDPAELKQVMSDAKKLRDEQMKKDGEFEKLLQEQKDQHAKDREKWQEERSAWAAEKDKNIRKDAIAKAIQEAGIAAPFLETMTPFLDTKIVLVGEGEDRKPMIGEKSPSEFLKEYVESDVGKHYVSADFNSGGGAGGAGGKNLNGGVNPFDPKTGNLTEAMKLAKENPKLAARLKAQVAGK